MKPKRIAIVIFCGCLAVACRPSGAVDMAGHVLDAAFAPVVAVKICVKSEITRCVTTDSRGAFHITATTPATLFQGGSASAPEPAQYDLQLKGGMLSLTAPVAVKARLELAGPDGRALAGARSLDLAAGRNAIALPEGLPANGICLIRLSAPGFSRSWKTMLTGPAAATPGQTAASAGRVAAVVAASTVATLEASKPGYRTRIYEPAREPELEARIYLRDTGDVGVTFTGTFHSKVKSIDRAQKKLLLESQSTYCDGNTLKRESFVDTSRYAIEDGKLWVWTNGRCYGQVFTGTGQDPVGTWNLVDVLAELPTGLRTGCLANPGYYGSPYENYRTEWRLGETELAGSVSLDYCPADLFGPDISFFFNADTGVFIARNTCKQLMMSNAKGENGTFTFAAKGDLLHAEFKYKTKTCSVDQDFSFGDKDPTCPDLTEQFYDCIAGSGFSKLAGFAKKGAGAKTSAAAMPPVSEEFPYSGFRSNAPGSGAAR